MGAAAKVPADNFKAAADAIAKDLGKVASAAGLSTAEFAKLNQRMLETTAQKTAEKAFSGIAKSAGLTQTELMALGKTFGFTSDQMSKMTSVFTQTTTAAETQKSALTKVKEGWAMAAAGIASALYVVQQGYTLLMKGVELGEMGAKIERTEAAFYAVAKAAGISADETVRALKMAAQGMMDESDIMVRASRLIQVGIPIQTLTELMALLVKQAPIVGDTLPEAWDKFGEALAKGKLKGVQNYIGLVDLEEEMKKYAASIGRTVEELTDESKMMITAEIVTAKLRETTKGLGDAQETASEKIQKAKVQMNEAHEQMAKSWIPVATGYYQAMARILEVWNSLSNRPEPDWVKKQKGTLGAGASGSWGTDPSKFTMDTGTATMTPLQLTFQKDEKAAKAHTENLKKEQEEYWKITLATSLSAGEKMIESDAEVSEQLAENLKWLTAKRFEEADKLVAGEATVNEQILEADKELNRNRLAYVETFADALNESDIRMSESSIAEGTKIFESRLKMERTLYGEIAKLSKNDFNFQRESVKNQETIFRDAGMSRVALAEWVRLKNRDIDEQELIQKGTFWDGMKVQMDRNVRDQTTWGQEGAAIWNKTFGPGGIIEGTLSSFFTDAFTGNLKTASEYFKSFCDAILKMFAEMIAKMIAKWASEEVWKLVTGSGTTGGGGTGVNVGGVTNAYNPASSVISGANTAYGAISGGIPLTGAGGALSTLWGGAGATGMESFLAASGGTSVGAGGTGTAVGGGLMAGAGAAALIGAAVIAYIKYGKANFGGTGYAMNPFLESNIPLMINPMGGTPGVNESEVMSKISKPDLDIIIKRFKETFGFDAPLTIASNDPMIGPISNWVMAQPEILAAQQAYIKFLSENYTGVQTDTGWSLQKKPRGAANFGNTGFNDSHNFDVTMAAGGGIIDEPMMAYGRSGKKILLGEAGSEAIIPLRDIPDYRNIINSAGKIRDLPGYRHSINVIGTDRDIPDYRDNAAEILRDMPDYRSNITLPPRDMPEYRSNIKPVNVLPDWSGDWWHGGLQESVASGRYGRKTTTGTGATSEGSYSGQQITITLNVDGKNLGAVLLDLSKSGVKVVHQRGITAN